MNNKQEVPTSTDVLIVGAGPTGMTLAVSLRQLGLDCVVIDRQPEPPNDARAAFVQPRTLEYLRRIHVAGPLVDDGIKGAGSRSPIRTVTSSDCRTTTSTARFLSN
jgi:2-polyprenyl-6-methoxyphenol hydroxylase-like FAD-dependent oxidoreductase